MKSTKIEVMKNIKNSELCRIKLNCNSIEEKKRYAICDLFNWFD